MSKTILAGTLKLATVQECHFNWAKPEEVRGNTYKLSKNEQ